MPDPNIYYVGGDYSVDYSTDQPVYYSLNPSYSYYSTGNIFLCLVSNFLMKEWKVIWDFIGVQIICDTFQDMNRLANGAISLHFLQ